MSYSITLEPMAVMVEACKPLFPLHWEEVAAHESVPLDPDWERYAEAERADSLWCWVCWHEGKPVGYCVFTRIIHLHYKSTPFANNDVIYILPQHRGKELGSLLVRTAEEFLIREGFEVIRWHIKSFLDWSKLLEGMGYEFTDKILEKVL